MADEVLAAFRARYAELDERLDAAVQGGTREGLKEDIVSLFRAVEGELAELAAFKEEIRLLVDRWKSLPGAGTPAGSRAPVSAPVRADHIGASTFVERGWSRISLGDYVGAEEALRHALELSPADPQTESLLGWAQMCQEKYDEALMHFHQVLMRQPTNALARVNVGYICLKKRIFGEAIEHLSKAMRLDNDPKAMLYAHYYLGLVYLEREMYDDAQIFFRRSLSLGPNLVEAYYDLGRAIWFGGDRDGAVRTWREGATANKFSPWGRRCAEMVEMAESGGEPPRVSAA